MDTPSELNKNEEQKALEDMGESSVLDKSVCIKNDLQKEGDGDFSEPEDVIVLNSSSEAEVLSDSKEESVIKETVPELRSLNTESCVETRKVSQEDDASVPMDIDEELTGLVPEVKEPSHEIDPGEFKESSNLKSSENNPEKISTEKEASDAADNTKIAELIDVEVKEASKHEVAEEEEPVLTPIGVREEDEDMEDDDGLTDVIEPETPAIIELFDDEEIDKVIENPHDLSARTSPIEKMDIDIGEGAHAEEVQPEAIKKENTNHDKVKNVIEVEREDVDISSHGSLKSKESLEGGDDTKRSIDINGGISQIISEKIRKVMDEEDSVFYGKECINYECEQKCKVFYKAPTFSLNFFKIPRKINKNQFICDDCYNKTVAKYEELTGALVDHQALLYQNIPKRQDFVEILDSSDEEDKDEGVSGGSNGDFQKETIDFLQQELDLTICEILKRVEIDNQISWTKSILKNKLKKLEDDSEFISNSLKSLQKSADQMHTSLYQCPKIKIKELLPLDLNTGRPYVTETEFTIPPAGDLTFATIEVNGSYFAVKTKPIASWLPCKVIELMDVVISGQKSVKYYKIKFNKIKIPTVKCVSAKHMAYGDPPRVRLPIGTRIIALFDGSTLSRNKEKIPNFKSAFYPGIIAEPLQAYNKYRYLVFFDDGYAQYVYHKDIRVVCHASENVWEDVHPASREFIHNYLTQYQKNRPMVQVKKGQSMITESNGKWLYAKVVDIDASLVQMQFDGQNRTEWIYRGSTRLGPLFKEKQTKRTMQASQLPRRSEPYVRYVQDDEAAKGDSYSANNAEKQTRAVAKKSITRTEPQIPVKHLNNSTIFLEDDNKPKGKVVYYTAKKNMPPKHFLPHECSPKCLFSITHNLSSYSPLAKPLLSGWERQIFKSKLKKVVVYRAPCGRRIRNMEELHRYLRLTKNILNVDNFDFDCVIHCLAEYVIESSIVQKPDLSEGAEKMIIPCINYYDNTMPPECTYSTKRIPTEGVNLNLDPDFLVGCDCEDDCLDKSKCSCWQLTLSGAKFGNPNTPPENIGYQYKRLPEVVLTGIYECNVKCKCSKNCLNRVVQHPLQMKLQVFKTSNRGWGLRCINDVSKGSFICIYAGHLLTEQNANEGGANSGDEYFAELDYIEVVERLKEGYESDVQEDLEESEEEYEEPAQENDSDEDFRSSASINKNANINTRLRARRGTKDFSDSKDDDKSKKNNDEDDEEERQVINFEPNTSLDNEENATTKYKSIRRYYGKNEFCYVMDAKKTGNIGRYFNHSCSPNLFVQNVFVDTHDLRFPWVAFFALSNIRAGTELTWNYNYEVGIVPGKVLYCECGAPNCRGRLL